jgi:hypothetical protein
VTTVTNVTTKFVARLKVLEKLQNVMAVTIDELNNACFVVKDSGGQNLAERVSSRSATSY